MMQFLCMEIKKKLQKLNQKIVVQKNKTLISDISIATWPLTVKMGFQWEGNIVQYAWAMP